MGNCLVTKLQGSVGDASLHKLGELFVTAKAGTSELGFRVDHSDGHHGGTARIVSGTGYFTVGSDHVQSVELADNMSTVLTVTATTDIVFAIPNKYYLNTVSKATGANNSAQSKMFVIKSSELDYVPVEQLSWFTGLTVDGKFDASQLKDDCVIVSTGYTNLNGNNLYGDITEQIKHMGTSITYTGGLRELFRYNNMYADLSQLPVDIGQIITNDNKSVFEWKGTRSSDRLIIGFPVDSNTSISFGDDLDAMLINQAACTAGNLTDPNNAKIYVRGNRTSASDTAVATLKSKGYTVKVNGTIL